MYSLGSWLMLHIFTQSNYPPPPTIFPSSCTSSILPLIPPICSSPHFILCTNRAGQLIVLTQKLYQWIYTITSLGHLGCISVVCPAIQVTYGIGLLLCTKRQYSLCKRRIFVYTFKEESQILWINSWCDAMPQVRNPSFGRLDASEALAHPLHLPVDRFPAAIQHIWIQISLQGNFGPYKFAGFGRLDAPVEPEDVVSCFR